jgi:hypothetical protein
MAWLPVPPLLRLAALLVLTAPCAVAAATISQQIDPPEANVGDIVTVTITIQNGSSTNIRLPHVDGLELAGTRAATNISLTNGAFSSAFTEAFQLQPTRAGDFTIPAFDIPLADGGSLHVQAMKLHVLDNASAPSPVTVQPVPNATTNVPPATPAFNPNGPVVMPPGGSQAPAPETTVNVPVESDGRPAKVFIVITPQTTDAYVGQSIPMRIEFYIREDVDWQQDSLPTIKGSDFLMNNFVIRPTEESAQLMNEEFRLETWITALSAPKSGDFPLQMERDSYWNKSANGVGSQFGNFFFKQPNLAHQLIPSNQLTMHIHALPDEGRPANFTGAIGQLRAEGSAQPTSVAVGEPVHLHFEVSGQGNFDYVRSPSLAEDPAWKSYVPSSKIQYEDEDQTRTHAIKAFDQSIIPQKNGTLPLPQASFSYFDPAAKQYVTIPINLPAVTVTGTPLAANPTPPDGAAAAAAVTPQAAQFLPNRLAVGSLHASLIPAWRRPWFWIIQGSLLFLLLLGTLMALFRGRPDPEDDRAGRIQRQNSLHQETDAMSDAVRRGDARAFFLAARHAVQLQLGANWRVPPEALTLWEIRRRDPQLAGTLEPLFTQTDEIIYSGGDSGELDLAQWERHVRELLQPQTQAA